MTSATASMALPSTGRLNGALPVHPGQCVCCSLSHCMTEREYCVSQPPGDCMVTLRWQHQYTGLWFPASQFNKHHYMVLRTVKLIFILTCYDESYAVICLENWDTSVPHTWKEFSERSVTAIFGSGYMLWKCWTKCWSLSFMQCGVFVISPCWCF